MTQTKNPGFDLDPIYFASGSNRAGEVRGFSDILHAIGVAAPEVMKSATSTAELKMAEVPVFLDSGAFSEVEFGADGPRVAKPIADADWRARLAYAAELGESLNDLLYFVAPDMVGFAGETLGRLSKYRREVARVAATGARVLVCLQGADKVDFFKKAAWALGVGQDDLVAALPMKKNATTPDEVVDFVRRARPKALHLLGLGAANRKAPELLARLAEVDPTLEVSLDSNLIRANVGRKPKARKLTAALDRFPAATVFARKAKAIVAAFAAGGPVMSYIDGDADGALPEDFEPEVIR